MTYQIQDEPGGLAQAFIIGENFIQANPVCLILGDNIFYGERLPVILKTAMQEKGATLFGYYVQDPSAYGVVDIDEDNRVCSLEEKPITPRSNYAVPGIYFYDHKVVPLAKTLTPSARGELEITDLNKLYMQQGELKAILLGRGIAWLDAGTVDDLLEASDFIRAIGKRQGLKIACIEEIAYRMGFISFAQLKKLADDYKNCSYGDYLQIITK